MTHSDQPFWLGFSLITGIGSKRIQQIKTHFGSLEKAWYAPTSELRHMSLDAKLIARISEKRKAIDLESELKKVHQVGAKIITLDDPDYPALLKQLPDFSPPVLYVKGELRAEDELSLAIVGTRKATKYGKDATFSLSRQLARHHVTIISGLAQGIDGVAHQACVVEEGRTIAVLGCGIDKIYPREHFQLSQKILENGAIISEFPVGTPPDGRNFPRRNRVISGMALGVLVAEAPENSGAIITANMALEQGRDVFAIPANIFNPMGKGTNRLIQDGAKLVTRVEDILEELDISYRNVQTTTKTERIQPTDEKEIALIRCLSSDPIHVDEIVRLSGLPISEVNATLVILELKGLAQMVGNMQYCLSQR